MRIFQATKGKNGTYRVTKKQAAAAGTGIATLPGFAAAAVPTDVTDLYTALATDFATLLAAGLVLWAAIKGPMVVWRLAKRVLGAGTN